MRENVCGGKELRKNFEAGRPMEKAGWYSRGVSEPGRFLYLFLFAVLNRVSTVDYSMAGSVVHGHIMLCFYRNCLSLKYSLWD
jgi:hypothetical protein